MSGGGGESPWGRRDAFPPWRETVRHQKCQKASPLPPLAAPRSLPGCRDATGLGSDCDRHTPNPSSEAYLTGFAAQDLRFFNPRRTRSRRSQFPTRRAA